MRHETRLLGAVLILLTLVLVGATARAQMAQTSAVAVLTPTEGNDLQGTVTFTQTPGGVRVQANLTGLTAGTEHGFTSTSTATAVHPTGRRLEGTSTPMEPTMPGPMLRLGTSEISATSPSTTQAKRPTTASIRSWPSKGRATSSVTPSSCMAGAMT